MIGGNITAAVQIRATTLNEIGEGVSSWSEVCQLKGWLDFLSGTNSHESLNTKIQDSTHVFICDYTPLDASVTARDARMIADGKTYEVTLIDDPMGLHDHLEIFLRYIGV